MIDPLRDYCWSHADPASALSIQIRQCRSLDETRRSWLAILVLIRDSLLSLIMLSEVLLDKLLTNDVYLGHFVDSFWVQV